MINTETANSQWLLTCRQLVDEYKKLMVIKAAPGSSFKEVIEWISGQREEVGWRRANWCLTEEWNIYIHHDSWHETLLGATGLSESEHLAQGTLYFPMASPSFAGSEGRNRVIAYMKSSGRLCDMGYQARTREAHLDCMAIKRAAEEVLLDWVVSMVPWAEPDAHIGGNPFNPTWREPDREIPF